MKKRWALLLSVLLLALLPLALAEEIPCVCGQDACTCFMQEGDGCPGLDVLAQCLEEKAAYVRPEKLEAISADMTEAVRVFQRDHDLTETGLLDDETLTLLLWDKLPPEMEKEAAEEERTLCFVPVRGGERCHKTEQCSGMDHPRRMSLQNALRLGYELCENCYPQARSTKTPAQE